MNNDMSTTATSSNHSNSLALKARLDDITRTKKVGKHKDGRPIRPLSAYNIFFQLERKRIMKEQANPGAKHAAGGFGSLASAISAKWKSIDGALKLELEAMARLDRDRYNRETEEWKAEMVKKAKDAEAAAKSDSAPKNVEVVPMREVVVDSDSMEEISPVGFISPLGLGQSFAVNGVPRLPFQTAQSRELAHPARFSFGNAAAGNPFAFNYETGASMMNRVTPYQPTRPNLEGALQVQVAQQVQPSNVRFVPRTFDGFQGTICAPCVPTAGSGRRASCPEVAAAHNRASDNSSRMKSDERESPTFMKGYVQGFEKNVSGASKPSNDPEVYIDQDGKTFTSHSSFKPAENGRSTHQPSYMKGYIEGFKASSEMWGMTGI